MSQFSDYAKALLAGGLPAILDSQRTSTGQGDTRPETTAPTSTIQDAESFSIGKVLTTQNVVIGASVIGGLIVLGLLLRR